MSIALTGVLSIEQAAKLLHIRVGTLYNWIYLGRAPSYIRAGRRILFDPRDLDAFIEARKVRASEPGFTQ